MCFLRKNNRIQNTFSLRSMVFIISSTILCLALPAWSSSMTGLDIAKEQVTRDSGWVDAQSKIRMILRSTGGDEYLRDIQIKLLEVENDGDQSVVSFLKPLDVKGTAFLTYSHIEKSDEQWIYLPAIKRIKRINAKNKSGPFMGSEFSYEDMSSFEYQDYTFNLINEDVDGDLRLYVVEQKPKDKYSGYSKRIVWVDHEEYRVHKIEFYDRKGDLLKVLTNKGFKQYLGQYWRPDVSEMVNLQTGKSTDLEWQNYTFKNAFSASDFNKSALKRVK